MKTFYFLIVLVISAGCNSKEGKTNGKLFPKPATELVLTLRPDTTRVLDTARVTAEIKGLLRLTDRYSTFEESSRNIESMVRGDSLLILTITPPVNGDHLSNMKKVLSEITSSPSHLASSDTQIKITETDRELLQLLSLEENEVYDLQPDFSRADWAYVKNEIPSPLGGTPSVYITTYIRYPLKEKAPQLYYSYAFDQENNGLSKSVASLMKTLGPSEVSYSITSEAPRLTALWDSIRKNHRLQILEDYLQLSWEQVDFGRTYVSPLTSSDTIIKVSIDKLIQKTPPHLFHLLIAPSLSGSVSSYYFK
ncbi:hypothetical protein ED312_13640 [Sinomicrobium pectinilyticum]|uniref:Uncharacterized protein n=1 Tax=Sinomicrobium pectinilyticum TaxID=1084421 RepID=A0A3N0EA63_SINP1|nr:hypothetical protein [Sinomicrobium pectinilyticum]RNL84724.1 hypothetical protein ED312_13640 [Sinomicrobium pectinilyticum]